MSSRTHPHPHSPGSHLPLPGSSFHWKANLRRATGPQKPVCLRLHPSSVWLEIRLLYSVLPLPTTLHPVIPEAPLRGFIRRIYKNKPSTSDPSALLKPGKPPCSKDTGTVTQGERSGFPSALGPLEPPNLSYLRAPHSDSLSFLLLCYNSTGVSPSPWMYCSHLLLLLS